MSDERGEQSVEVATGLRTPFVWTVLLALGLGCFLYYSLFFPPDHTKLVAQGEEFFFEANEAARAPVLLLSLWLLYRRSHYRDVLRGAGALVPGLAALALTVALYVWGAYTRAEDIQLASVMGLLTGVVLLLGGRAGLRAYWLPIVFLAFALPLSPVLLSAAMYPIQLATASYAGVILNSIGVASYVQGDQILRPENTFVVIETCSGVRTIVTLSMLTVLLIDLFERRGAHAVILILLAPFVAFLTNGLRVVTLVLNPHSSIHSIHNLQGVAMLLVGLTAIYLLDLLLERALGSRAPRAEAGDVGGEIERRRRAVGHDDLEIAQGLRRPVGAQAGLLSVGGVEHHVEADRAFVHQAHGDFNGGGIQGRDGYLGGRAVGSLDVGDLADQGEDFGAGAIAALQLGGLGIDFRGGHNLVLFVAYEKIEYPVEGLGVGVDHVVLESAAAGGDGDGAHQAPVAVQLVLDGLGGGLGFAVALAPDVEAHGRPVVAGGAVEGMQAAAAGTLAGNGDFAGDRPPIARQAQRINPPAGDLWRGGEKGFQPGAKAHGQILFLVDFLMAPYLPASSPAVLSTPRPRVVPRRSRAWRCVASKAGPMNGRGGCRAVPNS